MSAADPADFAERRRHLARAVQRRLVDHITGLTTDLAPALMFNDASAYTDPARAEREVREIFGRYPLVAGFSRDLPGAGDALLFEDLGPSIVVVRGDDGVVRGFLNMCTHRGSKLVCADAQGKCDRRARIVCPFHAWSFRLDGSVAATSSRSGFRELDAAERHLVQVPVAEWSGILFVRPTPGVERLDVAAYLGAFAPELAQLELAEATPVQSSVLRAPTNWKCALDTYCESYHFGTLHASTIGRTHYSDIAVFEPFAPHFRVSFPENALAELTRLPESQWPTANFGGIHFLFPNTILVVGSTGARGMFMRLFRIFPGADVGQAVCRIAVYVGGDPPPTVSTFAQNDAESDVTQEDYRMAVESYANLVHAPPGFKVVYGRNEVALQAFHRSLAEALGALI